MIHKGVKIKLKHDFAIGLMQLIDIIVAKEYATADDMLIMAGLVEIRHRLIVKVEKFNKEYSLTLTPVQSISMRLLYTDFINEPSSYMGNKLLMISNEVAKKYSL